MRRRAGSLAVATACLALLPAGGAADASPRRCPSFGFKHNGVQWHADSIRVRVVSCRAARALVRTYAEPRNCQFQPKCRVSRYTCRTRDAHGSVFTESCTRGRRLVRWHGSYVSR